ncbi:MAG: glutamine synthetase, partial [Clostridia bacterium]|nr:glutamine synthetase [Clostridia bacterium]
HGVMSATEIRSREDILLENYAKIVNIEALTMIEMVSRDIIPAVNAYLGDVAGTMGAKLAVMPELSCEVERDLLTKLSALNESTYRDLAALRDVETAAASEKDTLKRAKAYCESVLPAMGILRTHVDAMECLTSSEYWPLPTYGDMMFKV